jgi:hypothetical protein
MGFVMFVGFNAAHWFAFGSMGKREAGSATGAKLYPPPHDEFTVGEGNETGVAVATVVGLACCVKGDATPVGVYMVSIILPLLDEYEDTPQIIKRTTTTTKIDFPLLDFKMLIRPLNILVYINGG